MVAGAVEDGELALPELVGLGKVLVELRDVQQVGVQPRQRVGHVGVSQSWRWSTKQLITEVNSGSSLLGPNAELK